MSLSTLRKIATGLLFIALLCSAYLAWNTLFYKQPILGCGSDSGCNNVLTSHWSLVAQIPTLFVGAIVYITFLSIILINKFHLKGSKGDKSWNLRLEIIIAYLIIFAGIWFFSIQAFVIKSYCLWCCTIHSLAVFASVLILSSHFKRKHSLLNPILALIAVALVAFTQIYFPSEVRAYKANQTDHNNLRVEADTLKIHNDLLSVKTETLPRLTSSTSDNICLILSDHTCPHCLEFQREIIKNKALIEEDLTIYYLPSYQSKQAREINRLLIIAKRANPNAYEAALDAIQNGSLSLDHIAITKFLDEECEGHFEIYKSSFSPWSYELMDLSSKVMKYNLEQAQVAAFPQVITHNHIIEGVINIQDLVKLSKELPATTISPNHQNPQALSNASSLNSENSSLIVEKKAFNLGRITKGEIGYDTINLKNPSSSPLKITKIRTSCGCIQLSREPITIAAESQVKLPFEFHTDKFLGDVTHKIFLYDEEARKPISIPISVNVWLPFKVFPFKNNHGKLAATTDSGKKKVSFINSTQQPVTLTLPKQEGFPLNASIKTISEGNHYEVTYEIKTMPDHSINTSIRLETSHPDCPEILIPVMAQNAPFYELIPETISSKTSVIKSVQLTTFTLKSYDNSILDPHILKAVYKGDQSDNVVINILPKKKSNHAPRFSVEFKTGFDFQKAKDAHNSIEIFSNVSRKSIFLDF